jgi:hypothetical protein
LGGRVQGARQNKKNPLPLAITVFIVLFSFLLGSLLLARFKPKIFTSKKKE